MRTSVKIRHWLPIITFCPENGLPDLLYVTVEFDEFRELYAVRKAIRKELAWRKIFMEEAAGFISNSYPSANVTVALAFNRHVVTIKRVE